MNQKRRVISFILAFTMIFQTGMSTFAAENSAANNQIVQEQSATENKTGAAGSTTKTAIKTVTEDTTKANAEVTTEASGEVATEAVTEGTTEGKTEVATEGTTEAAIEVTTELPTDDLTQADTAESTEAEATTQESTLTKAGQLNSKPDSNNGKVELVDYALLESDGKCYITNADGTKTDGEPITNNNVICHLFVADDVTEIESGKFHYCKNLTDITFSKQSSLTTIGQSAFFMSGLTEISLPDSVTTIALEAFSNCENLKSIETSD